MRNQKRRKASGARIAAVLTLMALFGSGMAFAAAVQGPVQVSIQGVQVHLDPVTGQLRQPTPAEVKALADALRSMLSTPENRVTQYAEAPDGTLSAILGSESLNIWVATLGTDGSLSHVCVEGEDAAAAALLDPGIWEER